MSNVDTTTRAAPKGLFDMRGSISPGDLGNIPVIIAGIPEGSKQAHVLGIIIGKTNAISFRDNKHGEGPSIALKGIFEFVSSDPEMIPIRAPLLYLPTNVQQIFLSAAMKAGTSIPAKPERGKSIDAEGNEVEIRVQMGVRRHPSPIGYQYLAMMIQDATKVDPLADMRNETLAMFGRPTVAITHQPLKTDPVASKEAAGGMTAPAPAKGAAKKK